MTKPERIALLNQWLTEFKDFEKACQPLDPLLKGKWEKQVMDVRENVCCLFDSYTELVALQVGDTFDWLNWFAWENDCGKAGKKAKASTWKKARKIRTIEDLEAVISADNSK